LQQKDQQVSDQSKRLAALEEELITLRRELEAEREQRRVDRQAEEVRERQRTLADKNTISEHLRKENEKELRRLRERME
jgi:hypothetical protein